MSDAMFRSRGVGIGGPTGARVPPLISSRQYRLIKLLVELDSGYTNRNASSICSGVRNSGNLLTDKLCY